MSSRRSLSDRYVRTVEQLIRLYDDNIPIFPLSYHAILDGFLLHTVNARLRSYICLLYTSYSEKLTGHMAKLERSVACTEVVSLRLQHNRLRLRLSLLEELHIQLKLPHRVQLLLIPNERYEQRQRFRIKSTKT